MATEFIHGAQTISRPTGADCSGSQNKFVKLDANGAVVPVTATTDVPFGLLLNAPKAGDTAHVAKTGVLKAIASSNVAIGDYLGVAADGRVTKVTLGTDTTKYVVGRASYEAGAANVYIKIDVDVLIPRTA